MNPLFDLISLSLGHKEALDRVYTREEWEYMLEQAKKQTLVGVLTVGLDKLVPPQKAPLGIYAKWMLLTEAVQSRNASQTEDARTLYGRLAGDGIRSCVLKGQGTAMLYPQPDLRQCGDIDVWVEGGREKVLGYFRAHCPVRDVVYHHFDAKVFKTTPVEVHTTPSWMNSPLLNRRLQRFFAENADEQFANFDAGLGFAVPTHRFNAVFSLLHIFRHLLFEGIGLRQLMDYYYILVALDGQETDWIMKQLRYLHLDDFAAALMYVMKEVFGLEDRLMLCPPDEDYGRFFIDEVMHAGNFGAYDERDSGANDSRLLMRLKYHCRHLGRLLRYCPREVLAAPLFKTWQFVWRRCRGYASRPAGR